MYSSIFQKRILFVFVFVHFQKWIIFIFVFVKILKNEYYSNNKILKWTSKNNIIPHIWGFLQILTNFHIIFTIFYHFLYFHLFFSKHFETYLSTIWIIFVFLFVLVVILKNEYYSYLYSVDFEKRILFVFVFGLKLLFVSSLIHGCCE